MTRWHIDLGTGLGGWREPFEDPGGSPSIGAVAAGLVFVAFAGAFFHVGAYDMAAFELFLLAMLALASMLGRDTGGGMS